MSTIQPAEVTITYNRSYKVRVNQTYTVTVPAELLTDEADEIDLDSYVCDHGVLISDEIGYIDNDDLTWDYTVNEQVNAR